MTRFEKRWGIDTGKCLARKYHELLSSETFSHINTPPFLKPNHSVPTCLWRWDRMFRNVGI